MSTRPAQQHSTGLSSEEEVEPLKLSLTPDEEERGSSSPEYGTGYGFKNNIKHATIVSAVL